MRLPVFGFPAQSWRILNKQGGPNENKSSNPMKTKKLITFLLLAGALASGTAQAQNNPATITSLVSTQRAGTMYVDINYNLVDPDNQGAYILVECSSDA